MNSWINLGSHGCGLFKKLPWHPRDKFPSLYQIILLFQVFLSTFLHQMFGISGNAFEANRAFLMSLRCLLDSCSTFVTPRMIRSSGSQSYFSIRASRPPQTQGTKYLHCMGSSSNVIPTFQNPI